MGISRYPRPGHRISPELLAPLLDVPIPWRLLGQAEDLEGHLCELDESTWDRLSPNICAKLGAAVVREISSRIASLPETILDHPLPLPNCLRDFQSLDDLPLEARTYNCLVSEGIADHPERLGSLTIGDLLKIRSFGAKSLVDLLATLESIERELASSRGSKLPELPPIDPRVTRYPRPGHRIAPRALLEILGAPLPSNLRRRTGLDVESLAELDEELWERLETPLLQKLGEVVVQEVDTHLPSLPPNIVYRPLPLPEKGIGLQDLEVERRTYNCLKREGMLDEPGRLYGLTVGEFLRFRGVGGKSLVDFLTALEHCHPPEIDVRSLDPSSHHEARASAQKLTTLLGDGFVGRDDPRLGSILRRVDPTAGDLAEVLLRVRDDLYREEQLRFMAAGLGELVERLQELQGQDLRVELDEVCTFGLGERDGRIIALYLGWGADGPQTLKRIGERFGLTRERVRQIGVEQVERLVSMRPYLPTLQRTLQRIGEHLPRTEAEVDELVVAERLSAPPIPLASFEQICRLLEIALPFEVATPDQTSLALAPGSAVAVSPTARAARRAVEAWGLGSRADLERTLAREVRGGVEPELLCRILEGLSEFRWLGAGERWFRLGGFQKNRIEGQLRKLFAVESEMHMDVARGGVIRTYRGREIAPPRDVLADYVDGLDWLEVHGDVVHCKRGATGPEALSASELVIVDLLRDRGPVLDQSELEELCVRRGVKRATVHTRLRHSPLLQPLPGARVTLRGAGAASAPGDLPVSLIDRRPGGGVLVRTQITAELLAGGPLALPPHAPDLALDFPLRTSDDRLHGQVRWRDRAVTGLEALFACRGGAIGDGLQIWFRTDRGTAEASLGESEWWDLGPQP